MSERKLDGYIVRSCKQCKHYEEEYEKDPENWCGPSSEPPDPCVYCRRWHEDHFEPKKGESEE